MSSHDHGNLSWANWRLCQWKEWKAIWERQTGMFLLWDCIIFDIVIKKQLFLNWHDLSCCTSWDQNQSSPNKLSLLLWDSTVRLWTQTVQTKRTSNIKWFAPCLWNVDHLFLASTFSYISQSMCCAFHLSYLWTSLFYWRTE